MATGLQPGNRRHRHDHMVLQTRLSGKEPGVPWDVQKVQGMGGCGESRKSLHKGHGIPGQSEPERLRKGRLDGAQRTAQTKKITEEAPGKRMPGALATAQQDKVCRVLPERTGGRLCGRRAGPMGTGDPAGAGLLCRGGRDLCGSAQAAVSGRVAGGGNDRKATHWADDLLPQGAGNAEHGSGVCCKSRADLKHWVRMHPVVL